MSSATTSVLSRQPLAQVLRNITDPRDRRGVRHSLFTVLSLAVTGVLAGCRSLTAIWEHTTDLTPSDLRSLGLEAGQALPSAVIHPAGAAGSGPHRSQHPSEVVVAHSYRHHQRSQGDRGASGETVRGVRLGQASAPHLLSALDHATGAVLTQARVAEKSNQRSPPSESFSSPSTQAG